ncbi:MAG TPA: lysylphosphatidylglycerol synthase domain-containing protein [Streptosporangiaceae bacterium]
MIEAARPGRVVRGALAAAFLGAAAIGMAGVLRGHARETIDLFSRSGAPLYLVPAVAASTAGLLFAMDAWRSLLAALGSPLGFRTGARIFFVSLLGSYVPGPMLGAAANVHLGRRAGVPVRRMVAAYLLNAVIVTLSAATVGLLAAPHILGTRALWLAPLPVVAVAVACRPDFIIAIANRAARLLRRDPVAERAAPAGLRAAVWKDTAGWLIGGVHLWLIAVVLGARPAAALPVCVGAFALATAAGTAVLVLPDGAGVRELVATAALATVLPWPQAAAAALASRACVVVAEALALSGVLLLGRRTAENGSDGRNPDETPRIGVAPCGPHG